MKRILMAAAIVSAITFAGCNAGGGDPKAVLTAFFDALSKKDFATAKKLATKDSEGMFSLMEMGMNMSKDKKDGDMDKFSKDKMIIGEPKIEGDKATVEVKDKEKGESVNFILKKESGSWKVAFDKSSLMQMGMENMKNKGEDPSAIMDTISNSLNKINTDSITEKVKEGMEELNKNKDKIEDAAKKLEEAAKKIQH